MGKLGEGHVGSLYTILAVFMKIQNFSKVKSLLKTSIHFQKGYIPKELDWGKRPKEFQILCV